MLKRVRSVESLRAGVIDTVLTLYAIDGYSKTSGEGGATIEPGARVSSGPYPAFSGASWPSTLRCDISSDEVFV